MTVLADAPYIEAEGEEPKRWKRQFVDEHTTPPSAITWRTASQKAKRLEVWRDEVGRAFPESGRILRLAWALEWLFSHKGFAYATDGFLSQKLAIPVNKIQSCLTELERSGAIVRASVFVRGRPQRRIWPSSKIVKSIPPTMGGIHTPHDRACDTPHNGGTEYLRKKPSPRVHRISSTADAARREAELREEAARRRSGASAPIDRD